MIYGVAGTNASGKDLLAEFLRDEHGFKFFHTSDFIRKEATKRYGNILRPTLFMVGNELRRENGPGVLMKMGLDEFRKDNNSKNLVVGSLRTTGEVKVLHDAGGKLIFLDASRRVRYKRLYARKREDDKIDYETFVEHEEAELHQSDDPAEFSILSVNELADIRIQNEGTIQEFYGLVTKALSLPTTDE